ncbi:MAG: hypothetical protein II707_02965, partial [Spirochaetales bacterium]|nr:hypothetical protein [Spirochaetales bacterium]
EQYRFASNWNTKELDINNFSPLDNDANDWAEGNKPSSMKIGDKIFKVSSWQDVFIKFIKHIKDNNEDDFKFILDNQFSLFNREDAIITWHILKIKSEQKEDLLVRYKTFDGLLYNKVENINDDIIFVHINISASSCMTRLANIMDKFNMSEDYVNIILKP